MSMILDALSRAEQERRSENGVALDPARYVGSSSIKEERLKKWILLALVVNIALIAIILGSYLWKENTADSSQDIVQAVPQSDIAPVPSTLPAAPAAPTESSKNLAANENPGPEISVPAQQTAQEPMLSLQEEARVNKDVKKPLAKKKAIKNVVKKDPPVRYATQPLAKPADKTLSSIPSTALPPAQSSSQDYTAVNNLSAAQRSQLNQYEINVHVYDSNVQNRFVLINMTKYKEGDRLSGGGPLIAAITPEGVIVDTGSGKALLERN